MLQHRNQEMATMGTSQKVSTLVNWKTALAALGLFCLTLCVLIQPWRGTRRRMCGSKTNDEDDEDLQDAGEIRKAPRLNDQQSLHPNRNTGGNRPRMSTNASNVSTATSGSAASLTRRGSLDIANLDAFRQSTIIVGSSLSNPHGSQGLKIGRQETDLDLLRAYKQGAKQKGGLKPILSSRESVCSMGRAGTANSTSTMESRAASSAITRNTSMESRAASSAKCGDEPDDEESVTADNDAKSVDSGVDDAVLDVMQKLEAFKKADALVKANCFDPAVVRAKIDQITRKMLQEHSDILDKDALPSIKRILKRKWKQGK